MGSRRVMDLTGWEAFEPEWLAIAGPGHPLGIGVAAHTRPRSAR